jgi:hypothetical protein
MPHVGYNKNPHLTLEVGELVTPRRGEPYRKKKQIGTVIGLTDEHVMIHWHNPMEGSPVRNKISLHIAEKILDNP